MPAPAALPFRILGPLGARRLADMPVGDRRHPGRSVPQTEAMHSMDLEAMVERTWAADDRSRRSRSRRARGGLDRPLPAAVRSPEERNTSAIRGVLVRFHTNRRRDVRSRPDHRPGTDPQAQESCVHEVPRRLWTHPLSIVEDIPWRCRRLVIGTGADGALPVMQEVEEEAHRRKVDLLIAPTAEAIKVLSESKRGTNAVLHVTC